MESIVFNQEELLNALAEGCKSICLCDNDYRLSAAADTSFIAIGRVTATVSESCAECERINMRFLNFTPKYLNQALISVPLKHSGISSAGSSSFVTSAGSFSTSYRMSGSYAFAGSYRFLTSYATSYTTSYQFASSFRTSFRIASSFKSSFASSFAGKIGSARNAGSFKESGGYLPVFGYGINLI